MNSINIAKFGGTSMANFESMSNCAEIVVSNPLTRVAVVSASAGVTNLLVSILNDGLSQEEKSDRINEIEAIQNRIINALLRSEEVIESIEMLLYQLRNHVGASENYDPREQDEILSYGERLSSLLFSQVIREAGYQAITYDARKIIKTDSIYGTATPDIDQIFEQAHENLDELITEKIVVTQGFIGSDAEGYTTTLGRGGSDYTAALIAEGLEAETCEIWTDVKGVYTTDPRIVPDAKLIEEISFEEAAEMANFGAKVLHPATMIPALRSGVKVFVGSSFDPDSGGTWLVRDCEVEPQFRSISRRKDQVMVTIKSPQLQYDITFISKIFQILSDHQLKLDLITTSETSLSFSIDTQVWNAKKNIILSPLSAFATISVESGFHLITIVGNHLNSESGIVDHIFDSIQNNIVRMICYGANPHNISFLVGEAKSDSILQKLHKRLFE